MSGPTLPDIDPAIVMVANPVYIDEISAQLAELDLRPAVRSLRG